MKGLGLLAASLLLQVSTSAVAGVTVSHYESLGRLTIDTAASTQQKTAGHAAVKLSFDAFGKNFDLQLEPNARLLSDASRQSLTGGIQVFRGELAGKPGSWSRIVVADGIPRGLIWDGDELFAVEAPGDSAVKASTAVIYRLADVYVPPGTMSCGSSSSQGSAASMYGKLVGELGESIARSPGTISRIDIGAIGDFEFFSKNGGNSEAAILTRLNNVDGIFSEQLGVQIHVNQLEVFTSSADPFGDTTVPGDLLDELAAYRSTTAGQRRQGLTHFFTGRDLDGNTVGIAYTDTLCQASYGAGLTQSGNNATFDSLVAAHELGHNFGAPHDGEAGSACEVEYGEYLMSPTVRNSDQFSKCSIARMQPRIHSASCIASVPVANSAVVNLVVDAVEPAPIGLNESKSITVHVENRSSIAATGVELSVSLGSGLRADLASWPLGSCTVSGQQVRCEAGSLAPESGATMNLEITKIAAGQSSFTASVMSAETDADPADNNASGTVVAADAAASTKSADTGGGGGGGSTGLISLVLLGGGALCGRWVSGRRRFPRVY